MVEVLIEDLEKTGGARNRFDARLFELFGDIDRGRIDLGLADMTSLEMVGGQIAQWRQESIVGLRLVDAADICILGRCQDMDDR